MRAAKFDTILVGGGLQTALLVLALRAKRPATRIAVVERSARLGGNHTWCFHAGDLSQVAHAWVSPLVSRRWPGYRVEFPGLQRHVQREYSAISSERLHAVVADALLEATGSELLLGVAAREIRAHEVVLEDGTTLTATVVIDARGPESDGSGRPKNDGSGGPEVEVATSERAGYQKFLGLELELEEDHGFEQPVLMDARVDQSEGFRFVYTLPLSERRLLIEDTYFSDTPILDEPALRRRIEEYTRAKNLRVKRVAREERGVLPMPWSYRDRTPRGSPLAAGYRGGWFHPGTGYSLPVAARLAQFVADHAPEKLFGAELEDLAREHARQSRYCRFLNRMLFQWYAPRDRRHIFERFYRLPQSTIERFYALRLTAGDRARLLVGRPPRGFSLPYRLRRRVSSET